MISLHLTAGLSLEMRSPTVNQDYWSVAISYPNGLPLERRFRKPPGGPKRTFSTGTLEAWLYNNFPHPYVRQNWPTIKPEWIRLVQLYIEKNEHP